MYKEARSGRGEKNPESTENRYLLCFPAINIPAALPWDASTITQLILLDYPCTTTASASQGLKSSFLFLARGNLSSLWRCLYSTSTRDKGSNITLMNSWNSNHSRLGRQKKKKIFSLMLSWFLSHRSQRWVLYVCFMKIFTHTHA